VGGILECAGVHGLIQNQAIFKATKHDDDGWRRVFAQDLMEKFPNGFTAASVYDGGLPFSMGGKWIYEHIALKSLDDRAAIRQLSSIIEEQLEGQSFRCGSTIKKLTQPAARSPRFWAWLEVKVGEE
jgi:hypothetical protein